MNNKEIYKIFDKAMQMLEKQTSNRMMGMSAQSKGSDNLALDVMRQMTARASIERLLGYEKTDDGKRIIKRVRPNKNTKTVELSIKAASGDTDAAEELLKLFTKEVD